MKMPIRTTFIALAFVGIAAAPAFAAPSSQDVTNMGTGGLIGSNGLPTQSFAKSRSALLDATQYAVAAKGGTALESGMGGWIGTNGLATQSFADSRGALLDVAQARLTAE